MRRAFAICRYFWPSPASFVGLVLCGLALPFGARMKVVDGALEVCGGSIHRFIALLPRPLRFAAITFGHVIIGVDHAVLDRVRLHEHVHIRQYERWGLFFFPAYLISSLVQLVNGRDPYLHNHFEREAFLGAASRGEPRRGG